MKHIALLGSTGSVGTQTLEVVEKFPEEMNIVALAAKQQIDVVEKQIEKFRPEVVCIFDKAQAEKLRKRVTGVEIVSGVEGLIAASTWPGVNFAMMAVVGTQALEPAVHAIRQGIDLGVANKEILVAGGELLLKEAKKHSVKLLPVDSEHSAIFQCLQGEDFRDVKRMILTASGGPFFRHTDEQLKSVTAKDAAKHPNWTMGLKVSIDCSTLMNKGFEVIEAKWLFGIDVDKIDVVIHPQSLVHSFVEFADGSLKAQISPPDMKLPIQYALTYPNHRKRDVPLFDFTKFHTMNFFPPSRDKFRCLTLAYQALKEGGLAPCYLNAANEVLVERFCRGDVSWLSIGEKLDTLLQKYKMPAVAIEVASILETEKEARRAALAI